MIGRPNRRTDRDDGLRPDRSRWVDLGGRGKFKTWRLAGSKYFVRHCGHPTANYPWYGLRPNGSIITSGKNGTHGYAFRYLDDAKVAVELEHSGNRGQIALSAQHRTTRRRKIVIVVNRNWLRIIGMPSDVVEDLEETRGLMLTNISSFAAGPVRQRYITALMGEATPRQLMLVGLSDRFDEARGIAASVIEICTSVDPTSTVTWMTPTPAQAELVVESLQKIDHPTARAIISAIAAWGLAK